MPSLHLSFTPCSNISMKASSSIKSQTRLNSSRLQNVSTSAVGACPYALMYSSLRLSGNCQIMSDGDRQDAETGH